MTLTDYPKFHFTYMLIEGTDILLSVITSLLGSSHLHRCRPIRPSPLPQLLANTYNLASIVTSSHRNTFFNPGLFLPFFFFLESSSSCLTPQNIPVPEGSRKENNRFN